MRLSQQRPSSARGPPRRRACWRAAAGSGDAEAAAALRRAAAAASQTRAGGGAAAALLDLRRRAGPEVTRLAAVAQSLRPRPLADALSAAGLLSAHSGAFSAELAALAAALAAAPALSPQCCADAAGALAAARHEAPLLFQRLAAGVQRGELAQATPRQLATMLQGAGKLCGDGCSTSVALAAAAQPSLEDRRQKWTPRLLVEAAWAMAAADLADSGAFAAAWARLGAVAEPGAMGPLALTQLHQVALSAPAALPPLPPSLAAAAAAAWAARRRPPPAGYTASGLEAAVGRSLALLGATHLQAEALSLYGAYRCDWAMGPVGARTLIEVDGPSHFARNATSTAVALGATRLKRRHVRRLERLAVVPYSEWQAAGGAATEFLRRLLEGAEGGA